MQPRDKFFNILLGIRSAASGPTGSGNIETVTAPDRLDADGVEAIRSALTSGAQRGSWHYVLDLTRVKSMDSPGLGMLVGALRSIRDLGGMLGLVTDSPRLKHILELCVRDRNCNIYGRKRDAIKALQSAASPRTAA